MLGSDKKYIFKCNDIDYEEYTHIDCENESCSYKIDYNVEKKYNNHNKEECNEKSYSTPHIIKIMLIGQKGVGKTHLKNLICNNINELPVSTSR